MLILTSVYNVYLWLQRDKWIDLTERAVREAISSYNDYTSLARKYGLLQDEHIELQQKYLLVINPKQEGAV
jgi:hypothetical protein